LPDLEFESRYSARVSGGGARDWSCPAEAGFWSFLIGGGSGEARSVTLPTAIVASPDMVAAKAGAPGGCESQASLEKHPTSLAHRIPQAHALIRNSRASGWRRKNDNASTPRMHSVLE
jgi:hypothetical protein